MVTSVDSDSGSLAEPGHSVVCCRRLAAFDITDLAEIREAFREATPCELGQAWLPKPDLRFAPGVVRTGWRRDSLLVFAELTDTDIFCSATDHNQRMWELGDTFEMFLQCAGQDPYVELHVTPGNHRLQLRFDGAAEGAGAFEDALVAGEPLFDSATWVRPESKQWFVFAEIPATTVCNAASTLPPQSPEPHWRFSFSRYDYCGGGGEPVLSSTSPHTFPNYHRRHEWRRLAFRE